MPGNVEYFLSDYLKIVRLRDPVYDQPAPLITQDPASDEIESSALRFLFDVTQALSESDEDGTYDSQLQYHGAYNNRFRTNGYAQLLATNLVVYLWIALVIAILWALCELKDYLVRRKQAGRPERKKTCCTRRWAPFMSNALVRLTYVMFLEICLCSFLTVSYADMDGESGSASGLQWFVALFTIFAIIALFAALVCLWFRRGPYIPGFYEPGFKHFWRSYWHIRPVS